jgi:hypothetical protein
MTTTQRVNLVRNAEEHIRALTAVIDLLVQSPDCQHELAVISRALSWLAFRAQPTTSGTSGTGWATTPSNVPTTGSYSRR